jgi:hypothetical protein
MSEHGAHTVSPFSTILEPHFVILPPAFREQFFLDPDAPYSLVFEGVMDHVWHRPRWLWPFFWALAQIDALFPETGRDISARMVMSAGRDPDGGPIQYWQRTFAFRTVRRFNAITGYDAGLGRAVEWIGPRRMLQFVWDVCFEAPNRIVITTARCALRLGPWRLWLPRWLTGTVRAIEHADRSRDDTIHIDLALTHLLLGAIFGYEGTFRIGQHVSDRELDHA